MDINLINSMYPKGVEPSGIKKFDNNKLPVEKQEALDLLDDGMEAHFVAKKLKINYQTLKSWQSQERNKHNY